MRAPARAAVVTLTAALCVALTAAPSDATFLPVGAGDWSSTNVSNAGDCTGSDIGSGTCTATANSQITSPTTVETCNNAGYVITQPVIIGTNFGCNVTFTATLTLTGTGAEVGENPVEIETGACAGLTLSGAEVTIDDNAVGTYTIHPRVVVTTNAWKFEGSYVSANISSLTAVIIHLAGQISPACTKVQLASGDFEYRFYGVFSGNYTVL